MNANATIEIRARLIGRLWMPAALAFKDKREVFSVDDRPFTRQWSGMRDALLHLSNDGDFQGAALADVRITVKRKLPTGNGYIVTYHPVNMAARDIADLAADPADVESCDFSKGD